MVFYQQLSQISQSKKLIAILTSFLSKSEVKIKAKVENLQNVSYICYLILFTQKSIWVLIEFGSKIDPIILIYTK